MPFSVIDIVRMSALEDQHKSEQQRKTNALNRLKMLKDDFEGEAKEHLKKYVGEKTYKRLENIMNTTINVFKTVIEEISINYAEDPQRDFISTGKGENEEQIKLCESLYEKLKFNAKMEKVCKYMNACNDVLIQVLWRNDKIDIDIITPNLTTIQQDSNDPTKPELIAVEKYYVDSIGLQGIKSKVAVWTATDHYTVDEQKKNVPIEGNENNENPYGVLPFIYVHKEEPDSSFWDETSGDDLYKCTLIVAVLQTLIDYYFVWNSFKQLAIRTDELEPGVSQSPDTALHLPGPEDTAIVLDFQIHIKALLESLQSYISQVSANYGVDWQSLALKIKEVSGVSLKIKNSRLQRLWRKQEKTLKQVEIEAFELIKVILKRNTKIDLNVELKIKYAPPEFYKDDKEELEIAEKEIQIGLKDLVMVFMERNRGYKNYEAAKEKLLEIIETTNELKQKSGLNFDELFKKKQEE